MKINFTVSGGFAYLPGLSRPYTIDTMEMDAQAADQLEAAVHESRFFEQSAQPATMAKGAADYMTYTITIEDGQQRHTIQVTDAVPDAKLRLLISQLRNMAHPSKKNINKSS